MSHAPWRSLRPLGVVALLSVASCTKDAGLGGTGETVVPRATLRQVEARPMSELSVADRPASRPTTAPASVELSLETARQLALENNLDLKVELLNPSIARERINQEEAVFESAFTTDAAWAKADSPTASQLESNQSESLRVIPGASIPLRTGGEVRLAAPLSRGETSNQFSTLNPAYASDLTASISHPLLRGAGTYVNAHRIRVAFYDYQRSQALTKLEVIRVLAAVDRFYWRLYAARRELDVRKQEYALAAAQLERAHRQVNAGAVAEVEIVRAESGVADRLEAIIIADNQLADRQRELKRLLNAPSLGPETRTVLVPVSDPAPRPYAVDPNVLLGLALRQRMEMLELELRVAQDAADVRVARHNLLPALSVEYVYGVNGLGRSIDDSFATLRDKNFEDHTLGLRLEVPVGNAAARSRLRAALLNRVHSLRTKEQRVEQIKLEVFAAADALEANWQRILAARKRAVLAARVVDLETRQFNQGLRTSTEVFDAQTKLADARSAEIAAVAEYQIAQVDIAFATGTLLGATKVEWAPGRE